MRRLLLCLLLCSACKNDTPAPAAPPPAAAPAGPSATVTPFISMADAVCACKAADCAEGALAKAKQIMQEPLPAHGEPGDMTRIDAELARAKACSVELAKLVPQPPVDPKKAEEAIAAYRGLAEEACACKDIDCLEITSRRGQAMLKQYADVKGDEAAARAIKEAGDKLQACVTKIVGPGQ